MDVKRFFEDRFRRYGPGPESLDWSEEGQRRRFEILSEVGDMSGRSVLDLGSGFGDFYSYIASLYRDVSYTGWELSEVFVREAKKMHPTAVFEVRDVFKSTIPRKFDFVVSSGLHNLETGTNDADMQSLLRKAWNAAKVAVAVNMLSIYADRVDKGCHQYDPKRMLSVALKLTRYTILRHDYMPHDFTIYMYREPRGK